jgi:hypothetical protein
MGWRTKSIAQVQTEFDRGELKRRSGPFTWSCSASAASSAPASSCAPARPPRSTRARGHALVRHRRRRLRLRGPVLRRTRLDAAVSGSATRMRTPRLLVRMPGSWERCCLLEYALAASVVAVGWSGYAVSLLHDSRHTSRPRSPQPTADGGRALSNVSHRPARHVQRRHGHAPRWSRCILLDGTAACSGTSRVDRAYDVSTLRERRRIRAHQALDTRQRDPATPTAHKGMDPATTACASSPRAPS